ncbi:MAG: VOC family protein [Acidobacteria bacterium]|nr:VOC family protein [Acidobacteriota bacterium]
MHLELITLLVNDYDHALRYFVDTLGFELVEDSPATTSSGEAKRWVVVRPPNAITGFLLARAEGASQDERVGRQVAERVGFFLRVDDFDETYARLVAAGTEFLGEPRKEPYGTVVVFRDLYGNRWDLLG